MKTGNINIASKKFKFAKLSLCVLADTELTECAKLVWCTIYQFCNNEKFRQMFHFNSASVATYLSISKDKAKRAIRELKDRGYLQRVVSGRTSKGGYEFDYLLSAEKFNSEQEAEGIIQQAYNRVYNEQWNTIIEGQNDTGNIIPIDLILAEKEQEKPKSCNGSQMALLSQKREFAPIYKNSNYSMKNNNDIVDTYVEDITHNEKNVFGGKNATTYKKEFVMCDLADFEIYHLFKKLGGFADYHIKGNAQQIQFYAMANTIKSNVHRLINKREVVALILFQKNVIELRKTKTYTNKELIEYVTNIMKNIKLLDMVVEQ